MRQHLRNLLIVTFCLLIAACGGGGGGSPQQNIAKPPTTPQPPTGFMGDGRLGEIVEWVRVSHALPALRGLTPCMRLTNITSTNTVWR